MTRIVGVHVLWTATFVIVTGPILGPPTNKLSTLLDLRWRFASPAFSNLTRRFGGAAFYF